MAFAARLRVLVCVVAAIAAGHVASVNGQTPAPPGGGDIFASSAQGRQCGYPIGRVDMNKILEAARRYPNPRLFIVTPREKRQIEQEIAAWNRTHANAPLVGMAPCFTCSSEYEACVVYQRDGGGDLFASSSLDSGGRGGDTFGSAGAAGGTGVGGGSSATGSTGVGRGDARTTAPPTDPRYTRCRDQVTVHELTPRSNSGMATRRTGPDVVDLTTGGGGQQGMRMAARATVRPGPINPALIDIRFVQNVTFYQGQLSRDSGPPTVLTVRGRGCVLRDGQPLLDMARVNRYPQPPFFALALGSRSSDPGADGSIERLAILQDSPGLSSVVLREPDGSRVTGVHVQWSFKTYLVCTVAGRWDGTTPYFETLRTVTWTANLTGRTPATGAGPPTSAPGASGVLHQPVVVSSERPLALTEPYFNTCTTILDRAPPPPRP